MAKYSIGSRVIKTDSDSRGTVIEVMQARRGRQFYKVCWGNYNSDELEVDLLPDCDISDPFERCISGIFGSYSEYAQKNTTFKISSSNNSTISSLKASKTLFKAYQFKPLLKFLNSPNRRLLIADEVGLGKTIEAGHIMMELKARNELKHTLIVCPKTLQHKWKSELEYKFGLYFKIYDNQKDLLDDMQNRSKHVYAIINYEKIRQKKQEDDDKQEKHSENIIGFLSENNFKFSLVLCDEAHKMRNRETQTYKGAEVIMNRTDTAVFLTATPVMISTENLYNLLHLLDNARYYNYQVFDNQLQENKPFIDALSELKSHPLTTIAENLDNAEITTRYIANDREIYSRNLTVGEAFEKNIMYQEIQRMLHAEDSYESRARLQYLISSMSMMNNIFSRTRKRDVTTDMSQAERKPHVRKIVLTDEEQTEFDAVIEEYIDDNSYTDEWGEEKLTPGMSLGLVQKKRQIASSVWGYLNDEEMLDKGIDKYEQYEDAKVNELLIDIRKVFENGTKKIVVFALFRKTLKYLNIRLRKAGYNPLVIHGQTKNRDEILQRFKNDENMHILLSSEVGSEGLDMQFCSSMVNYDLPWNPMVVEQRIGRIDRFGQKSPVVNIYNFIVADSIQEDIYMRLLDRIGIFRGTIGDMEAILDATYKNTRMTIQDVYNKMEKEFFTKELTKEEIDKKIIEVEQAIANEKENLQHLEEDLNSSLTNDAYFKEEIKRLQTKKAYVTDVELCNYLQSAIRQELPTCSLNLIEEDIYELKLPVGKPQALQNFLTKYMPIKEEVACMIERFKNEIRDRQDFRITFSQEKAYAHNDLMFLNIYHPIIQTCLSYFSQKEDKAKNSFSFALKADDILESGETYYMAIYKISVARKLLGVEKHIDTLLPLLYSVNKNEVISTQDVIDRIYSRSQTDGIEYNPRNKDIEVEMIRDMQSDFVEALSIDKKKRVSEIKLQVESDRQRNEQQTTDYFNSMIKKEQQSIRNWQSELSWLYTADKKRQNELQGAIRFAEIRIKQYEEEKENQLNRINEDSHINVNESIVSLNLITII